MNRKAFIFFLAALVFAPLAFGAVEHWSIAAVELLVCLATLFFASSLRKSTGNLLMPPGMLPLVLLILWMFFQLIPLPPVIVQTLAPSIYDIYKPVLENSDPSQWIPLTVNQKETFLECLRIGCYALFYFLTVQILSNGDSLKKTIRIVGYLAIAIAFLAIIQKFSSPDRIYWFRGVPANAQPIGPWVYHNHYAGFMEMTFPIVFALFLFYRPVVDSEKSLRSRVAAMFSAPGSNLHFFLGFGAVVIAASICISLSRGGIISLSLALILFLALLPRKIFAFKLVAYGLIVSCVAILVTWLGWGSVIGKFGTTFSTTGGINDIRPILWHDSIEIIRDFLFTGTGFGTFIHIYPLYSTLSFDFILDHAHNDYIELLSDGGLIGFILAGWFVLAVLRQGWQRIRTRRERYAILLSIGSFAGIVAILFHSVTDFNLHNGANGLYFFFLCGLLVAAGNTRIYFRTRPTLLDKAGPKTGGILIAVTLLLTVGTLILQGGTIIAGSIYAPVANTYLNRNLAIEKLREVSSVASRASELDPLAGRYVFAFGSAQVFLQHEEEALAAFGEAAEKNPLSGIYLQRLALMLTQRNKAAAERLMATAYARALNKDSLVLTWAEWLLAIGERDKAVTMLGEVFSKKPLLARKFMPAMTGSIFTREETVSMLPDSVSAWAHYGELAEKQGRLQDAEFYRTRALDFLDREPVVKPWYFNQLYDFYKRHDKDDEAFNILREASENLPEYAKFHVYLGDRYRREGIIYRAEKEYEQALLLDPADEETRAKLEELR